MNPEVKKFSRQVMEIMPLIFKEFSRRKDNDLSRGKISCSQMVALDLVSRNSQVHMKDIALQLGIQMSSATALIQRLIRQKMLKRHHDEEDRRLVWVTITPRGRKVVNHILDQKRRSIEDIFSVLKNRERKDYLRILKKVYVRGLKESN